MSSPRLKVRSVAASTACVGLLLVGSGAGSAVVEPWTSPELPDRLAGAMDADEINRHLLALQRISDSSGGSRAASTEGHERSAEYLTRKLESAGFDVTHQEFPFRYTETRAEQLTVAGDEIPIIIMRSSPSTPEGGITAPLAVIEPEESFGCAASDYGNVLGQITLVQRGECDFAAKQQAAAEAGAVGSIVYNNEEGPLNGTLGDAVAGHIPVGGVSLADGAALMAHEGADVTLDLRAIEEERTTFNVLAETKTGRKDNVVMAGAHLDSVTEGPGINDNGTGSGALLETALALGGDADVNNAVRFAWWSAEEFGLVGSTHYVNSLSAEQQLDIALYTNFDMIGSPNPGYFVYDGDDSDGVGAGPGPYGSAQIEQAFVDYLENRIGVPTEGTDFDGRSDYGEFIAVGIPAGGLFTGAEGVKTPDQARKWGGQAGVAYDECYHQECDNLGNVDRVALERNAMAMAYVTGKYALSTEDVNDVVPRGVKDRVELAQQRAAQRVMAPQAAAAVSTPDVGR